MFSKSPYLNQTSSLWQLAAENQLQLFSAAYHQILNNPQKTGAFSEYIPYFSAQKLPNHAFTMAYSGHQFGHFAGILGDGRALNLGVLSGYEYQLKGAGPTPFSRGSDGLAVVRSSIREYLAMRYMQKLNIPTTKAVMITLFPNITVQRETLETSAIIVRRATSFARFGHIEYLTYFSKPSERLQNLTDFVNYLQPYLQLNLPNLNHSEKPPVQKLWLHVIESHAKLLALWQSYGFCHGVLNTDNMSLLGLTLDYGPFAWLQNYTLNFVCNHSDHHGRYRYNAQPDVFRFNFLKLWQSLMPLLKQQLSDVQANECFKIYEEFDTLYQTELFDLWQKRVGIFSKKTEAVAIPNNEFNKFNKFDAFNVFNELIQYWGEKNQLDLTLIYQDLMKILYFKNMGENSNQPLLKTLHHQFLITDNDWKQWINDWLQHFSPKLSLMEQHNPSFCLRNGLLQDAISQINVIDIEGKIEDLFQHKHHQPYQNYQLPTAEVILSCSS